MHDWERFTSWRLCTFGLNKLTLNRTAIAPVCIVYEKFEVQIQLNDLIGSSKVHNFSYLKFFLFKTGIIRIKIVSQLYRRDINKFLWRKPFVGLLTRIQTNIYFYLRHIAKILFLGHVITKSIIFQWIKFSLCSIIFFDLGPTWFQIEGWFVSRCTWPCYKLHICHPLSYNEGKVTTHLKRFLYTWQVTGKKSN